MVQVFCRISNQRLLRLGKRIRGLLLFFVLTCQIADESDHHSSDQQDKQGENNQQRNAALPIGTMWVLLAGLWRHFPRHFDDFVDEVSVVLRAVTVLIGRFRGLIGVRDSAGLRIDGFFSGRIRRRPTGAS